MSDFSGPLTIFDPSDLARALIAFCVVYVSLASWVVYSYLRVRRP